MAELQEDAISSHYLSLYWDYKRLNVAPTSVDGVGSRTLQAFRVIDAARKDVAEREQKAREAELKRKNKGKKTASTRPRAGRVRRAVRRPRRY